MSTSDPFAAPPERPGLNPYEHVGHTNLSRWGKTIQIALLLFGVVVALQMVRTFFADSVVHPKPDVDPRPNGSAAHPVFEGAVPYVETKSTVVGPATESQYITRGEKIAHEHEVEAAKILQDGFLHRADDLTKHLADWRRELELWAAEVEPLLTNDAGKAIATDANAAQTFRAVYESKRPTRERLENIQQELNKGTHSVRIASEDDESALHPDEKLTALFIANTKEASEAAESWRAARAQIKALVQHAGSPIVSGSRSLETALAEQQASDQRVTAEAVRVAKEKAQQAADAQIAEAEAQKILIAGDVKARKIIAAAEADRTAQSADEERQRQQAELDRRKVALQRDMTDVKRYLAPFIAKGYAQPNGYFAAQTATAGPMSYSRIVAAGALKESREGMQLLVNYATRGNDRERAGFPTCDGSEYQWAELNKDYVRRAQELLTLYGDLLVEQGLLAK